jgi:hypothetical protein
VRRTFYAVVTVVLFAMLGFAHGNDKHVMGTVTQISQDSVKVQTTANTVVEVMITADTKFMKGTAAATQRDVQVGDRVVIHAMPMKDGMLMAHTVQIGVAKAAAQSH